MLVAVDGRQPGYSVGLTNFELAQALVRLGAVTGMALDSGGSTTMAFDGTLLNRPSDGQERRISNALMLEYQGVFASEPPPLVSPNGDGVDDVPGLRYRVYRPSTVTAALNGPARRHDYGPRPRRSSRAPIPCRSPARPPLRPAPTPRPRSASGRSR